MSTHVEREAISAYVDGELDEATHREVASHLDECPGCCASVASDRALKHGVAGLQARQAPPEAVRARIDTLALQRRRLRIRPRRMVAAAALLVACGGIAAAVLWPAGSPSLAHVLVADHLHSIPAEKPPEVSSGSPDEVERFFEGRVPFTPVVPELPDASLLGARLCNIRNRPVELLFYERKGHTLSLFVGRARDGRRGCDRALDHAVCYQRSGELSWMLVGKLPSDELRSMLRRARATAR